MAERAGATVLVAENGYLGAGGTSPKFDVHPAGPKPDHFYALAESWHNGGGRWPVGGHERFLGLGLVAKAWRAEEGRALVCPNRSFGPAGRAMPTDWAERKVEKLRKAGLQVRLRKHPGNDEPKSNPLQADLDWATSVHIWSSTVGVHALVEGIRVESDAPYWICKHAAGEPSDSKREVALTQLAWAQWSLKEIETGEPFRRLLSTTGQREVASNS